MVTMMYIAAYLFGFNKKFPSQLKNAFGFLLYASEKALCQDKCLLVDFLNFML